MVLTVILISCRNRFLAFRLLGSQDGELCRNLTVPSVTLLQLVVNMKNEASVGSVGCELVRVLKMRIKASNLLEHPSVNGRAKGHSGSGLEGSLSGLLLPSVMGSLPV